MTGDASRPTAVGGPGLPTLPAAARALRAARTGAGPRLAAAAVTTAGQRLRAVLATPRPILSAAPRTPTHAGVDAVLEAALDRLDGVDPAPQPTRTDRSAGRLGHRVDRPPRAARPHSPPVTGPVGDEPRATGSRRSRPLERAGPTPGSVVDRSTTVDRRTEPVEAGGTSRPGNRRDVRRSTPRDEADHLVAADAPSPSAVTPGAREDRVADVVAGATGGPAGPSSPPGGRHAARADDHRTRADSEHDASGPAGPVATTDGHRHRGTPTGTAAEQSRPSSQLGLLAAHAQGRSPSTGRDEPDVPPRSARDPRHRDDRHAVERTPWSIRTAGPVATAGSSSARDARSATGPDSFSLPWAELEHPGRSTDVVGPDGTPRDDLVLDDERMDFAGLLDDLLTREAERHSLSEELA